MSTHNKYGDSKNAEIEIINSDIAIRENRIRKELALNVLNKCQTVFDRIVPNSVDREVNKWRRKIIAQEALETLSQKKHVPEPSMVIGIFAFGFLAMGRRRSIPNARK